MLGRSNWSVNIYCMKAASYEDKPSYILTCVATFDACLICVRTMHDKPDSVSRVYRGQQRPDLTSASIKHALLVYCNLVIELVKS